MRIIMRVLNKTIPLTLIIITALVPSLVQADNHLPEVFPYTNVTEMLPIQVEKSSIDLETRVVRIGLYEAIPIMFTSEYGYVAGLFPEILDAIAEEQGWIIDYVPATREQCIANLEQDKIDLLINVVEHENNNNRFVLSKEPLITTWKVAYSRSDILIKSLQDLSEKTIAITSTTFDNDGSRDIKRRLKDLGIPCQFTEVQNDQEVMMLIDSKQVDVGIVDRIFAGSHQKDFDVSPTPIILNPNTLHFAVKKGSDVGYRILEQIDNSLRDLKKDSNSIYYQTLENYIGGEKRDTKKYTRDTMENRRTSNLPLGFSTKLTKMEQDWLKEHSTINVVYNKNSPPIEFLDKDGAPKGISFEYLNAIENILGIKFVVHTSSTRNEIKKYEYDLYAAISPTTNNLEHLNFTHPYLTSEIVIFGKKDMSHISKMINLQPLKIGIPKSHGTDELIAKDYPDFNIIKTSTVKEAFSLLENRTIDVVICNSLMGNYCLSNNKYHDIKIIGETQYTLKLGMATRNDWPIFIHILNKALNQLPEAEENSIYRKWMFVEYEHGFNYSLFWKIFLSTAVIIFLIAIWNRVLSKEIKRRKVIEGELSVREKELRKNYAKLEELEELRDNLIHMVIHDMRSPITVIDGAIYFIEKYIDPEKIDDENTKYINMAKSGSQTLNRMIQSLLDINKFENDKMPLNKEKNLKNIALAAINNMQIQSISKNIRLVFDGESASALFDKELVLRVCVNLINNAIHASDENTKITVRTYDCEDSIIGEVVDTGHGIPEDQQEKIFEKFASAKKGKARAKSSIGLGLAFCKLTIEAHDGKISVTSRENRGSTFKFEIPKKET
jgi:signal transduction histidine kinase/membrane-bound lytic murein transglycosylase MltF